MHSDYIRLNVKDVLDKHPEADVIQRILFGEGIVSSLIGDGCYVAGGFGRALMRGDSILDYAEIRSGMTRRPGDIDIFFSDVSKREEYRKFFVQNNRSFGGSALEAKLGRMRIQLVDHDDLIHPLDDQMDRFDFTNACVAITRDHVIVHRDFKELEDQLLLDVKRNVSPFLGSRIMKYFKHRGLTGVTPRSEPLITEWIMRVLCDDLKAVSPNPLMKSGIDHNIQALLSTQQLTRADDLLLVLGRYKSLIMPKYGPALEVDFALHQLKERGVELAIPGF